MISQEQIQEQVQAMKGDTVVVGLSRNTGFELDASIDLSAGGVTALFGVSGCGKTTVLRSAAGLEKARGFVRLGGEVWQDDSKKCFVPTYARRIGYVFQEASLFDHLNVRKNLEYGLKRIADPAGVKRLDDAVELLGIGHLLDRQTGALSGGERQRCAIARSLAIRPSALFMDEPLAALDHARRLEIMPWLERIKNELSIPILYVTHSQEEVLRLADTLVVMQQGRVVTQGPVADVWHELSALGDGLGERETMVPAVVTQKDAQWKLMQVSARGASFWVADNGAEIGSSVRLIIVASDVALSLTKPENTSIQNTFECRIEGIQSLGSGAKTLIDLNASGMRIFCEITARSAYGLGLEQGKTVWALVKSVALR